MLFLALYPFQTSYKFRKTICIALITFQKNVPLPYIEKERNYDQDD